MKEIKASKTTLMSLLKHVKSGKKIFVLCKSKRHVKFYYGYLITEAWHYNIDATVVPILPSPLPSSSFSSPPSRLYKLTIKKAGEIIFTEEKSYMASYEGHIMIKLVSKN